MKFDLAKPLSFFSIFAFPILLFWFAYRYKVDEFNYVESLREDRPVEWFTFALLLLAGLVALDIVIQLRQREGVIDWFYLAFALFCLLVAFEEVSWGQRVFDFQSPELFLTKSDQQEVNVHNLLQQQLGFKTKTVAGFALAIYGCILPLLALNRRASVWLGTRFSFASRAGVQRVHLVLPPLSLVLGFALGGLLMRDEPTGFEEEIGELFFALCFFLFMLFQALEITPRRKLQPFQIRAGAMMRSAAVSRFVILALTLLAFALRVWGLDAKGLSLDEATIALLAQAPVGELFNFEWQSGYNYASLWPLVLGRWTPLTGANEVALRLLPAFAGALTIPILWQLLRLLWPADLALRALTCTLVVFAPTLLLLNQSALTYSTVVLLSLLSLYLGVALVTEWRLSHGLLFVLVNWLMLAFHMLAILLILAEALFFLAVFLRTRRSSALWPLSAALASGLPFVLWAIWAPGFEIAQAELRFVDEQTRRLRKVLETFWRDLTFGSLRWQPRQAGLGWLLLPLLIIGLIDAIFARSEASQKRSSAGIDLPQGLLFVLTLLLPVAVGFLLFDVVPSSYLAYVIPLIYVLVALGILRLWRSIRLLGVSGLLATLLVAFAGTVYYRSAYQPSEYRAMAHDLAPQLQQTDGAVLLAAPRQHSLARYYIAGAPLYSVPELSLDGYWPLVAQPLVLEEVDAQVKEYLATYPTLWLALADEETVDPGEFLPKYLTAVAYKEDCDRWQDVVLCRYASPRFDGAQTGQELGRVYGGELLLDSVALTLSPPRVDGDRYILTRLEWATRQHPTIDYKLTLRLVDEAGETVEQADDFPIGPLLPPTTWSAQDAKTSFKAVELEGDLAAGDYRLMLGVYDPATLELVGHVAPDEVESTEMIVLAEVQVGGDQIEILPLHDEGAGQ